MSLTISLIYLSPYFDSINIEIGSDMFGFEICRKELWGNQKLKNIGCKIIPKLEENDLYILSDELEEIYQDSKTILKNITEISLTTNYSEEFIRFRINNLIRFIEIALENKRNLGISIS